MPSVISLTNVSISRGARTIIHDVSLEVTPGEVLALVGPNGAGKSTLLSALAGEIKPDSGSTDIFGAHAASYRPKELATQRATLLQSNDVSFPFLVADVVRMGRNPWAGSDAEDRDDDIVAHAMADAGVEHLAHRRFNELSGGERARVSLARVLAQDTPILLLDEPTAALDLHHQDRVMALVRAVANSGRAVVVVVHDLSLAAAYADRIALIVEGRIDSIGTARDVLTEERLGRVYDIPLRVIESPDGHPMVVPVRST